MAGNNLREALVDEIQGSLQRGEAVHQGAAEDGERRRRTTSCGPRSSRTWKKHKGRSTRLERVFELLDEKPRGKHCAGMAGIIEEGNEKLEEDMEDAVMDACIIEERAERRAL